LLFVDPSALKPVSRWTPERRAFALSVVIRPLMLAALLLLLWGHVELVALVVRTLLRGPEEAFSHIFDPSVDRTATILNSALPVLALGFWVVMGLGWLQRRGSHPDA
jgi:hypothetical protein